MMTTHLAFGKDRAPLNAHVRCARQRLRFGGQHDHRQRGVALAISLVLLVALTVLGVATLSTTRMSEKVTSNSQQKAIAFEAAESAIRVASDWAVIYPALLSIPADDNDDPAAITLDGVADQLDAPLDQSNDGLASVNIDTSATLRHCGEYALPRGTSLDANEDNPQRLVQLRLDINGLAAIDNSVTRADHVSRLGKTDLSFGISASCVSPGL